MQIVFSKFADVVRRLLLDVRDRCATVRLPFDASESAMQTRAKKEAVRNFDSAKAAQVVAFFAMKTGNEGIGVLMAMKLVYLADRENIERTGVPILNELRASFPNGPVKDLTYAFANGEFVDVEGWSRFLQDKNEHQLQVVPGTTFADLDRLSKSNLATLEAVWAKFGWWNVNALVNWTHKDGNIPEWQDPKGSKIEITLEAMMTALGIEDAARKAAEIESDHVLKMELERP